MEQEFYEYAERHTTPETPLLRRIHRETYQTQPFPRMLSGHLQGMLLQMVCRMIRPERVLEIGAFTGYSAIFLARGMPEGGILDTIEVNPELEDMLCKNFGEAGLDVKITLHMGDAMEIIPRLEPGYGLVFLDADKEKYLDYYHLVFEKTAPGGFILVDNVLWGGKVLQEIPLSDKEGQGIAAFNAFISQDERVERLMLPFRDGLMILRKL